MQSKSKGCESLAGWLSDLLGVRLVVWLAEWMAQETGHRASLDLRWHESCAELALIMIMMMIWVMIRIRIRLGMGIMFLMCLKI